jgi:hypothetical protein
MTRFRRFLRRLREGHNPLIAWRLSRRSGQLRFDDWFGRFR